MGGWNPQPALQELGAMLQQLDVLHDSCFTHSGGKGRVPEALADVWRVALTAIRQCVRFLQTMYEGLHQAEADARWRKELLSPVRVAAEALQDTCAELQEQRLRLHELLAENRGDIDTESVCPRCFKFYMWAPKHFASLITGEVGDSIGEVKRRCSARVAELQVEVARERSRLRNFIEAELKELCNGMCSHDPATSSTAPPDMARPSRGYRSGLASDRHPRRVLDAIRAQAAELREARAGRATRERLEDLRCRKVEEVMRAAEEHLAQHWEGSMASWLEKSLGPPLLGRKSDLEASLPVAWQEQIGHLHHHHHHHDDHQRHHHHHEHAHERTSQQVESRFGHGIGVSPISSSKVKGHETSGSHPPPPTTPPAVLKVGSTAPSSSKSDRLCNEASPGGPHGGFSGSNAMAPIPSVPSGGGETLVPEYNAADTGSSADKRGLARGDSVTDAAADTGSSADKRPRSGSTRGTQRLAYQRDDAGAKVPLRSGGAVSSTSGSSSPPQKAAGSRSASSEVSPSRSGSGSRPKRTGYRRPSSGPEDNTSGARSPATSTREADPKRSEGTPRCREQADEVLAPARHLKVSSAAISTASLEAFRRRLSESRRRTKSRERRPSMELLKGWLEPKFRKHATSGAFGDLPPAAVLDVLEVLERAELPKGKMLVEQGETKQMLVVVAHGCLAKIKDTHSVGEARVGEVIGEMALQYAVPWQVSLVAGTDCIVWTLDQQAYQMLNLVHQEGELKRVKELLRKTEMFEALSEDELSLLCSLADKEEFEPGSKVINEGEVGDRFYLLLDGECEAYLSGDQGEKRVMCYTKVGDFFGELALLLDQPRAATVRAGPNKHAFLLSIARRDFDNVIGHIRKTMLQHLPKYPKYSDVKATLQDLARAEQDHCDEAKDLLGRSTFRAPASPTTKRTKNSFWTSINAMGATLSIDNFALGVTTGTGTFGRVRLVKLKGEGKASQSSATAFALKSMWKYKVIQQEQVDHVLNEISVLRRIEHQFITNMITTFQDEHRIYLLLEFINGGELFSRLRQGRLKAHAVKFYASEIVFAFEYMHALSIVYRDLKPENVLLDSRGHVKLIDMGFAKVVPDRTWTLCGTPEYIAPEILRKEGYNCTVDWWTLGILLFELLAGRPPFEAPSSTNRNLLDIYHQIQECDIELRFHAYPSGDFVEPVRDLIRSLLHKDWRRRLGCQAGGSSDVKAHLFWLWEYYGPQDAARYWDAVNCKEMDPPWVPPRTLGADDTTMYDQYPESDEEPGQTLSEEDQRLFADLDNC